MENYFLKTDQIVYPNTDITTKILEFYLRRSCLFAGIQRDRQTSGRELLHSKNRFCIDHIYAVGGDFN